MRASGVPAGYAQMWYIINRNVMISEHLVKAKEF